MTKVGKDAGRDRNRARAGGRDEGQEQGAGRLGGTAGAQADRVQPWAVGARGEAKWALCRGCALRVLLMGAQQKA